MKIRTLFLTIMLFSSHAGAGSFEQLNRQTSQIDDDNRIHEEAVELESVLISKMIEPMFPDGKESGLYGGGHGSDIFRQMMIDEYAKTLATTNGLGLAESIERDLKK
ncbi:MAG: hypothetical protein COV35_09435 [Alphaproteobacteria bacterium CG11_big_fil_rev_8_21_14_0_20_39_49]|nr:MAG: hypothetical protein COV35_09435 [Alphaproteobacteria bacterium CG11_big_fil_rev_8_21_14_0_20_39_49]